MSDAGNGTGPGNGSRPTDPYREWDAAYVLGALSAEERREYEAHLGGCDACAAAVAELAGMPGLLAAIDLDSVDLTSARVASGGTVPPHVLPRLLGAAQRERRRTRTAVAGALVGVAAVAASLALILPSALTVGGVPGGPPVAGQTAPTAAPPADSGAGERVRMEQVVPSPLSADFTVSTENWGSRIETRCRYGSAGLSRPQYDRTERAYALYVTDLSGAPSVVATWSAGPGSSVDAVGTTHLSPQEIASVDIRSLASGQVLLASTIAR